MVFVFDNVNFRFLLFMDLLPKSHLNSSFECQVFLGLSY